MGWRGQTVVYHGASQLYKLIKRSTFTLPEDGLVTSIKTQPYVIYQIILKMNLKQCHKLLTRNYYNSMDISEIILLNKTQCNIQRNPAEKEE